MAKPEESGLVKDVLLEQKLVEMWPDYPCLYAVRSADFKNRDLRQQAVEEIANNLGQTGAYLLNNTSNFVKLSTIR